jgi:hypothetical protein
MSDWTSPTIATMTARQVIQERIDRASQPRRAHRARRHYLWER